MSENRKNSRQKSEKRPVQGHTENRHKKNKMEVKNRGLTQSKNIKSFLKINGLGAWDK